MLLRTDRWRGSFERLPAPLMYSYRRELVFTQESAIESQTLDRNADEIRNHLFIRKSGVIKIDCLAVFRTLNYCICSSSNEWRFLFSALSFASFLRKGQLQKGSCDVVCRCGDCGKTWAWNIAKHRCLFHYISSTRQPCVWAFVNLACKTLLALALIKFKQSILTVLMVEANLRNTKFLFYFRFHFTIFLRWSSSRFNFMWLFAWKDCVIRLILYLIDYRLFSV